MYARHNLNGRGGNAKPVADVLAENPLPAGTVRRSTRRNG